MACSIKNGNKDIPIEMSGDAMRICVVGGGQVGKTTFCRAFAKVNTAGKENFINGVRIYPCEIEPNSMGKRGALYEIPSHPNYVMAQKAPHYDNAQMFIFMYAIDDPSSLDMLTATWLPETIAFINANVLPVGLLGNKKDLRNDPKVIERLALNNEVPVTPEQTVGLFGPGVEVAFNKEISSKDSDDVLDIFLKVCHALFNITED